MKKTDKFYFKVSLISFAVAFVSVFLEVVFVLLPIYGLVSPDMVENSVKVEYAESTASILRRTQYLVYVFGALISLSMAVGLVTFIMGITKRAKNSKH